MGKVCRVFGNENSCTLLLDYMNHLLGESAAVSNILKGWKKSDRESVEQKLLRGVLCSSTSLAFVNEVLEYGERKTKHENARNCHDVDGKEAFFSTSDGVFVRDSPDLSRVVRERMRHLFVNYLLSNIRNAVKGIGKDDLYVVSSNFRTEKVSGFMLRMYQEGRKE